MRILIVRLSALGDAVLTLPLYFCLRDYFPDAFIGWVVEERNAGLLEAVPGINRVHRWPASAKNLRGAWALAREIKVEQYDVALDAQGLTKSAALPFLAGVRRRVGFRRAPLEARELAPLLNNCLVSPPAAVTHIAERSKWLAQPLGVTPREEPARMRLEPGAAAASRIDAWRAECADGRPLFLFGVGTSWETKIWPPEHMRHVVQAAVARGYQPVVTWGPAEEARLPAWQAALGPGVVWGPRTSSVAELIALVAIASRYAGPDSAPLHLAWLMGIPTFSWFGPSSAPRGAPTGRRHRHVVAFPPNRQRHGEPMWGLKPETVLPEFNDWLDLE